MLKKNGGITLIALVVTIIVLLILAGISIAMLTGNNGIITRTNDSKMSQIEGQVYEEIKLAVQSAKIYSMQKSVETSTGWFANQHFDDSESTDDVKAVLQADLPGTKYSVEGSNVSSSSTPGLITITYVTGDYKAATNYQTASIIAKIKVNKNNFEIRAIKATRSASENRYLVGDAEVFASPLE